MSRSDFLKKYIRKMGGADSPALEDYVLSLLRKTEFFEDILNRLDEAVLTFDARRTLTFCNRALGDLFQTPAARLVGRGLDEVFRPVLAGQETLITADQVDLRQSVIKEVRVEFPEERFLSCRLTPVPGRQGPEVEYLGVLRDVTAAKKMEENRIKDARLGSYPLLASGVAHEIGNPLNALSLHLQLLEKALEDLPARHAKKLAPLVRTSSAGVEALDRVVKHFLGSMRPLRMRRVEGDLNEVLREVAAFMEPEIRSAGASLVLDLADGLPRTTLDPLYLSRAFINLIKNAAQALHAGGRVTVRSRHRDGTITVEVEDDGVGIDPQNQGRLFEPYFTTKPDGSGLGLMMVYRAVTGHDGTVEIRSRPGRGTTVVVSLPVRGEQPRFLPSGAGKSRRETGGKGA